MIRFLTGGESHGEKLTGIIDGIPANLFMDIEYINNELARRQSGYGRSVRMNIEKDELQVLSGVKNSLTIGSPISILINNKGTNIELNEITKPRPGHGDLVGALKYNQVGGRNILERASARETSMRVGLGSICKLLLREFNIQIFSHVINIGGISSQKTYYNNLDMEDLKNCDSSPIRCIDKDAESLMIKKVSNAMEDGNTLGGSIEIVVKNIPVGLGSHTNWDMKLDGLLSQALLSIPGIKAVEFGRGIDVANMSGDNFHDEIYYEGFYKRKSNNAGGIEAGISNGEDLVIKIYMKPIPTLRKPLGTIDMITKETAIAISERSDVCAVPSASIVGESMVSFVLANELTKKFGGDSLEEMKNNFESYNRYLKTR